MDIIIRPECPGDENAITEVTHLVFANTPLSCLMAFLKNISSLYPLALLPLMGTSNSIRHSKPSTNLAVERICAKKPPKET